MRESALPEFGPSASAAVSVLRLAAAPRAPLRRPQASTWNLHAMALLCAAASAAMARRWIAHWRVKNQLWVAPPRSGSRGPEFGVLHRPRVLSEKRRASQLLGLVPLHFQEAFREAQALAAQRNSGTRDEAGVGGAAAEEWSFGLEEGVRVVLQKVWQLRQSLAADSRKGGSREEGPCTPLASAVARDAFLWVVDFDLRNKETDSFNALSTGEAGLLLAAREELLRPRLCQWLTARRRDGVLQQRSVRDCLSAADLSRLRIFTDSSLRLLEVASRRQRQNAFALHSARFGIEHLRLLSTLWGMLSREEKLAVSPNWLSLSAGVDLRRQLEAAPLARDLSFFLEKLATAAVSTQQPPPLGVMARAVLAASAPEVKALLQAQETLEGSSGESSSAALAVRRHLVEVLEAVAGREAASGASLETMSPSEAFAFVTALAREGLFNSLLWTRSAAAVQRRSEACSTETLTGLVRAFASRSAAAPENALARSEAALVLRTAAEEFLAAPRAEGSSLRPLPWSVCCGALEAMAKTRVAHEALLRRIEEVKAFAPKCVSAIGLCGLRSVQT